MLITSVIFFYIFTIYSVFQRCKTRCVCVPRVIAVGVHRYTAVCCVYFSTTFGMSSVVMYVNETCVLRPHVFFVYHQMSASIALFIKCNAQMTLVVRHGPVTIMRQVMVHIIV